MMKAMDCADYIIDYTLKNKLKINNLQLQKALYVFAAEYIRLTGEYPYDESILAWNYGPTIFSTYKEYKGYCSASIEQVSTHPTFNPKTVSFTHKMYDITDIDKTYQNIVENYLRSFLKTPIFDIVEFIQKQKFYKENREIIYRTDDLVYPVQEIHLNGATLSQFLNIGEKKMNFIVNDNLIDDIEDLFMEYGQDLLSWSMSSIDYESGYVATLIFPDCEVYLESGRTFGYKIYDVECFYQGIEPFKKLKELLSR